MDTPGVNTPGNKRWDVVAYIVYRDQAVDEDNPLAWCKFAFRSPENKFTVIGFEKETESLGDSVTYYVDDARDPRVILRDHDGKGNFLMFAFKVIRVWGDKGRFEAGVYPPLVKMWERDPDPKTWAVRVLDWMVKEGLMNEADKQGTINLRRSRKDSKRTL